MGITANDGENSRTKVQNVGTDTTAKTYEFARRERRTWLVVNALLGPLGLGAMAGIRSWPAREACPGCGVQRIVTRETCGKCEKPFERPAADGSEILVLPSV